MKPSLFASRRECSELALVMLAAAMPLTLIHAMTDAPQGGLLYFVNTTSDSIVIGACENSNPGCSLRGAIQAANANSGADGIEINLPAGSVINLTSPLPNITEGVGITGPGADKLTVRRNTGGNYRIFNVVVPNPGIVSFSGMTISNGSIDHGGGIMTSNTGTVNVNNCTLSANSAGAGYGGGIHNFGGTTNATNCTLSGNSAGDGGGIFNEGQNGVMKITNCTLRGNSASSGGAIFIFAGQVNVTNCTISGNSATSGGGVFLFNMGATMTVKSSLIALNTANSDPDVFSVITSSGFNLIGNNEGAVPSFPAGNPNANNDIVGTSASPIDPKLDPAGLQNNGGPTQTIALQSISPAIDKGTSNGLTGNPTTDQRGTGFPRTFDNPSIANATGGNGTDIGAFELLTLVAVSRKIHGVFVFDLDLPLTSTAGIECRTSGANGDHQVIVTFPSPVVSLTSANVTTGTGSVSSFSVNGAQVTINLTGVANAQKIVITLFGVSDGTNTNDVSIPMGVLLGDTSGNGSVNASDISQTKSKSGQAVNATNFRIDVTVSNSINATDVSLVKSKSGTALP
jgi:CSLREA domain-containing protein